MDEIIVGVPESEKEGIDLTKGAIAFKGKGCPKCGGAGLKGRIGLYEVFYMDEEVANLMDDKIDDEKLWAAAKKQGMITMKQDGILKVLRGMTTIEEVERVTEENILVEE